MEITKELILQKIDRLLKSGVQVSRCGGGFKIDRIRVDCRNLSTHVTFIGDDELRLFQQSYSIYEFLEKNYNKKALESHLNYLKH